MDNNTVDQNPYTPVAVPLVTTTVSITTTTCGGGSVASHGVSATICSGDEYIYIPVPDFRIVGCPEGTFTSYRITQLPNNTGKLQLGGVDVTLNQNLTKEQMSKLVYKLTSTTITADNAKFVVYTSVGVSPAYNIDIAVVKCNNAGCADCTSTTTAV